MNFSQVISSIASERSLSLPVTTLLKNSVARFYSTNSVRRLIYLWQLPASRFIYLAKLVTKQQQKFSSTGFEITKTCIKKWRYDRRRNDVIITSHCIFSIRSDKGGFIRELSRIRKISIWYDDLIVKDNLAQNCLKLSREFVLLIVYTKMFKIFRNILKNKNKIWTKHSVHDIE